ncbi:MAG: hypothetical protein IBX61_09715 [Thermoleophilia bacterium]|nr:hypothetical protein [Thermoleophilia bacterium]
MADQLCWMNIDYGIRVAGSCWDRIGLLIDVAFKLKLETRCSFPNALKELLKKDLAVRKNKDFVALENFEKGRFRDLQAGPGKGARNDVTHYFTSRTRYFFTEILEDNRKKGRRPKDAAYWIDFLVNHHTEFITGEENSRNLIRALAS